jgi:hypothetical protein
VSKSKRTNCHPGLSRPSAYSYKTAPRDYSVVCSLVVGESWPDRTLVSGEDDEDLKTSCRSRSHFMNPPADQTKHITVKQRLRNYFCFDGQLIRPLFCVRSEHLSHSSIPSVSRQPQRTIHRPSSLHRPSLVFEGSPLQIPGTVITPPPQHLDIQLLPYPNPQLRNDRLQHTVVYSSSDSPLSKV